VPTYSYQCTKCGHGFDVFHGINAKPRIRCPECGASCKRLLGAGAGVIFKGSGFYETDYKKGNGQKSAAAAPASGAASEAKASEAKGSKAETKSAASSKSDS